MMLLRYVTHLTLGARTKKSAPKTLPMSDAMLPMNGCKVLIAVGCTAPTDRPGKTLRMLEVTLPTVEK